jgi:hypothetical protein
MMAKTSRTVQWQQWQGSGLEHLVLHQHDAEASAESVVICPGHKPFAARYRIAWDAAWLTRRVEVEMIGTEARMVLTSDGRGNWAKDGKPMSELKGALDPDLTITAFTNTFPIRRLRLKKGQSADIMTAFIEFPELRLINHPQRYTRLDDGKRYLYESRDSDFRRELEVDRDGLVVTYDGLFRML